MQAYFQCSGPGKSAFEIRSSKAVSVNHDPPLSGDHVLDREIGSVLLKKTNYPTLDSFDDAESSGGEQSSSNPKISRASVASQNQIRLPKRHVIANAITSDWRRETMHTAHQQKG